MVTVEKISEIRPTLANEFNLTHFVSRTDAIADAYQWGQKIHKGQKRLSGEPYFETHCGWVAGYLDALVQNETWTIAALLHDTTEDHGVTLDQIRARYPGKLGEDVAYIVNGVTKLSVSKDGRSRELETLRKLAMFRDPGVFLVKLADKTHNMMTLRHMDGEKAVRKAEEAIRAYGRLAGILNCYRWRRWLEDMAFPFADPQTFAFVKPAIDNDPRLEIDFINETMQNLAEVMDAEGIPGRIEIIVNGYWQAWQKLRRMARQRQASLNSFNLVNDVISFRLVVESGSEKDCYTLLAGINRFLGPYLDQNRFDDYIALPQNGYRAIQVTAWYPGFGAVEVAIATDEMEAENAWGIIHSIQKGKDISEYRPVVFLTPTGGVRFVPEGSSILDAIATIQHEFLLDKISSVKVNGALARLADKVQAGDVIEVVTGIQRVHPNEEWLNFSNNSTARLLRSVLANEALITAAEKGRLEVRSILVPHGILALEDIEALERGRFDTLLARLSATSLADLYSAIGGGAIRLQDLTQDLNDLGMNKQALGWTTVNLIGGNNANRPGVLAILARLVSEQGGNILRTVHDTLPDGSFSVRLVIKNLGEEKEASLREAFLHSGIELKLVELV